MHTRRLPPWVAAGRAHVAHESLNQRFDLLVVRVPPALIAKAGCARAGHSLGDDRAQSRRRTERERDAQAATVAMAASARRPPHDCGLSRGSFRRRDCAGSSPRECRARAQARSQSAGRNPDRRGDRRVVQGLMARGASRRDPGWEPRRMMRSRNPGARGTPTPRPVRAAWCDGGGGAEGRRGRGPSISPS